MEYTDNLQLGIYSGLRAAGGARTHLGLVEVHSIHGQLLGILQEHQVCLGRTH